MIITVIEIYITICISYLLLCIKLPPKMWYFQTTGYGQYAHSLTS